MHSSPEHRRSRLRAAVRIAVWLAVAGLVAVQPVACLHARAMTTYVDGAEAPTATPEELSWSAKLRTLATGIVLPRPRVRTPPDAVPYEELEVRGELGRLACWLLRAAREPSGDDPRTPAGRAFLFPGYGQARDSLLGEALVLRELGWDVVLVDFRGCGGSAGEYTTLGWSEARDVVDVVDALRAGRTLLYGQSMGAVAALRAVGELGLAVDALVLESPFDSLLNTVRHRFDAMGLPNRGLPELLVFWGGVLRGFDGFQHRPRDAARGVRAPVLVLRGAADTRVRADDVRAVVDSLAGPARLHEFAGVGHQACLRLAPAAWRAVVARFVDDL